MTKASQEIRWIGVAKQAIVTLLLIITLGAYGCSENARFRVVHVKILDESRYVIDGKAIQARDLKRELAALPAQDETLVIHIDAAHDIQTLRTFIAAAHAAGIERISYITKPETE